MSSSNDLSTSLASQPFDTVEMLKQKPQTTLCVSNFTSAPSLNISTASLADSSSCTLAAQHQYHYIQYPPYYHHFGQQTAMPQMLPAAVACHCHCACGAQEQQQQQGSTSPAACRPPRMSDSMDSKIVVQVHRQAGGGGGGSGTDGGADQEAERERDRERERERPTKAQSEQSLLNHSYQTLQLRTADIHSLAEEKPLNVLRNSRLNISCDCDLECTCGIGMLHAASTTPVAHVTESSTPAKSKQCHAGVADAMLGADEITVSESDNNSTMIKKKKFSRDGAHSQRKINSWCHTDGVALGPDKKCDSNYNSSHIDIYSDGENKDSNDIADDHRPPLPPRPPPPRLRHAAGNRSAAHRHRATGIKKYVVWCLVCGGCSCLLGILFLGVYFLLHSYTITVGNFETVPTFVPAALLILTGLCIMSLARRRNRYSYLIKLSGACGLISALTCALVTVTTTVLHMSRLQALRECEYAQKTRTCTCYSDMIESQVDRVDKEGVRLVFDSLSDCGVVHGSLYSCLRAIFGLSVAGVLIAVFSCMLVYQLLSHERKKMYWEQLELRCRSLYTSQQGPAPNMALAGRATICRCCEQCHAHRQAQLQATPYTWDDGGEPRFWTGQPPGNFYSPNPGGDDLHATNVASACRGHGVSNTRSRVTGWSWPRMPWQRSSPDPNARQFRQTPSSPDSQYGFTNNASARSENTARDAETAATHNAHSPFNVVATGLPYGVWGPPPPYSDPNSPARRGYYQYIQPNSCNNSANNNNSININNTVNERPAGTFIGSEQHMPPCLNHRSVFLDQAQVQTSNGAVCCPQTASMRRNSAKRQTTIGSSASTVKSKVAGDYENTPSDSDGGLRDRFSNTLPTRKMKKRIEAGSKACLGGGPNIHPQPAPRISVQQIFPSSNSNCVSENEQVSVNDDEYQEQLNSGLSDEANDAAPANCSTSRMPPKSTPRHKRGVENTAFQATVEIGGTSTETTHEMADPTESEVYFADVSSCCNMSLKNDNYYEDANQVPHNTTQHHHQNSNCSHNSSASEDYLAQRFGQRENSIRSRLPFPQVRSDDDDLNIHMQKGGGGVTTTAPPPNHMQKEMSRQSMCSIESEAKTDFTDLSPATPCSNQFAPTTFDGKPSSGEPTDVAAQRNISSFVATFAYSESQSLEAHRRSTKDAHELMLTPEAHYEVINDNSPCQFAIGSSNVNTNKSQQQPQPQSQSQPHSQPQQQPQRPNNLVSSKRLHELTQMPKQKHTSKSRERLNAPTAYQVELEWAGGNHSVGGGGGGDRQCL